MPTVIYDGRGHKHRGSAANTSQYNLASNCSHCHPADSVYDTDILLSHTIFPSLCKYGFSEDRERVY